MKHYKLIITLVILLLLVACGNQKSQQALDAEMAIAAIGEIDLNSEEKIKYAEKLYSVLTETEKAQVENRLQLIDAREVYDKLASDTCRKLARNVLFELDSAGRMCSINVEYIGRAWYFGIHGDSNNLIKYFHEDEDIIGYYASEVGFGKDRVKTALDKLKYRPRLLYYDNGTGNAYYRCVLVAVQIMEDANLYEPCKELMILATQNLQEIREKFPNYEYLADLELYFGVVANFYEFTKSPSGSYSALSATVSGFENDMQTYSVTLGSKINTGK